MDLLNSVKKEEPFYFQDAVTSKKSESPFCLNAEKPYNGYLKFKNGDHTESESTDEIQDHDGKNVPLPCDDDSSVKVENTIATTDLETKWKPDILFNFHDSVMKSEGDNASFLTNIEVTVVWLFSV